VSRDVSQSSAKHVYQQKKKSLPQNAGPAQSFAEARPRQDSFVSNHSTGFSIKHISTSIKGATTALASRMAGFGPQTHTKHAGKSINIMDVSQTSLPKFLDQVSAKATHSKRNDHKLNASSQIFSPAFKHPDLSPWKEHDAPSDKLGAQPPMPLSRNNSGVFAASTAPRPQPARASNTSSAEFSSKTCLNKHALGSASSSVLLQSKTRNTPTPSNLHSQDMPSAHKERPPFQNVTGDSVNRKLSTLNCTPFSQTERATSNNSAK
jgi:hypothetical protein